MRRLGPLVGSLAAATAVATLAVAGELVPWPLSPDKFNWAHPLGLEALQAAWVVGEEKKSSPYLLRVRIAPGGRIPPHVHPDERNTTVLSGTVYVGFGEIFDETRVVAIPTGSVYTAPANVPHYIWAKDGAVEYQESGVGPTATTPLKKP